MTIQFSLDRRAVSEGLGTCLLVTTVVGSGIMAENLSGGNVALALLGNTIPTGAILFVLITMLGPISGAHLNPAVTISFFIQRKISGPHSLVYIAAQVAGGIFGTVIAHLMFNESPIQVSAQIRSGGGQWLSEGIATFGLVMTIIGTLRWRPEAVPTAVALFITAAYWFAASTSFANPAVTISRSLTDSFSGIAPLSAPAFIGAQIIGAILGTFLMAWLLKTTQHPSSSERNR
ncbi:MAG: aquaporin family protein [Proteobacteria bacterium]|nr:aquaporin family protein [Pseudomonadota bacterium]MBT6069580.1 aquaporin family protein [Pseudomonadota bacterium]